MLPETTWWPTLEICDDVIGDAERYVAKNLAEVRRPSALAAERDVADDRMGVRNFVDGVESDDRMKIRLDAARINDGTCARKPSKTAPSEGPVPEIKPAFLMVTGLSATMPS